MGTDVPLNADAQSKLRFGVVSKFWEKFTRDFKAPPDPVKEFLKKRNEASK